MHGTSPNLLVLCCKKYCRTAEDRSCHFVTVNLCTVHQLGLSKGLH
uniref:Uncharacterized protein n=1 Tax=Anguilla anguilla TaxID=7936 RepID=A0A0E9V6Q9_ANGAN